MKNIGCVIIAALFVLVSFCMTSCGSQGYVSTEGEQGQSVTERLNLDETTEIGEQQGGTTIYRISKVVEKTDNGEDIYTAEYDDAGNPLFYKITRNEGESTNVELEYNDSGLLEGIKVGWYYDDGELADGYEFLVCSKDDNMIELYERGENGENWLLMDCQYSNDNHITSQRYYHNSADVGVTCTEELYSYNDKGDLIGYHEIDNDDIRCSWEYENTYNQNDKLEKVEITKINDVNGFEEYTYDNNGNIISKTVGNLFGEIRQGVVRYEWAYDNNGNVLTEALYDIYEEEYVYKREYTYFACNIANDQMEYGFNIIDMTRLFPRDGWWDINPNKMNGVW